MLKFLLKLAIVSVFAWGCTSKDIDPSDAQGSFAYAREPFDDGLHEIALTKLGEFKSRFPYSKFAVEAELLMADSQFELGRYTEAAFAYKQFAKLHPKHPKVDYALYRVGQSYWEDAPEEIDREQEYTQKALAEWEKLVSTRPDSSYAKKAREKITIGKKRVAASHLFVVNYYCKRKIWHACAYRAMQLADTAADYPEIRLKALDQAVGSLERLAKEKSSRPESDTNLYFKQMNSEELQAKATNLRKLIADYRVSLQEG